MIFVDPTGTVDLVTTTEPGFKLGATPRKAFCTYEVSATPFSPCGVGRQTNTKSAVETARSLSVVNCKLPLEMPSIKSSGKPASTIGHSPRFS